LDWLEAIREDLRKATIVRIPSKEGYYEYVVNPLSSGVPEIPTEALWGCAFEVARISDVKRSNKIVTPEAMGIQIAAALSLVTGVPMLVIRKKSYMLPNEIKIVKRTGYAEETMYANGLQSGDSVPAGAFGETAQDVWLDCDEAYIGNTISFSVTNTNAAAKNFGVTLLGDVDPRDLSSAYGYY
jgi:hypothetical protein